MQIGHSPQHNVTQVNKLTGDLHKRLLQQGRNKVILASPTSHLPLSNVSTGTALENVNPQILRRSEPPNPEQTETERC